VAVNLGLYTGVISRHSRHTMSNVSRQSWVFVGGTKWHTPTCVAERKFNLWNVWSCSASYAGLDTSLECHQTVCLDASSTLSFRKAVAPVVARWNVFRPHQATAEEMPHTARSARGTRRW